MHKNGWMKDNGVDPNEIPHPVASDLGLLCLLRPFCLSTHSKYGDLNMETGYNLVT